MTNGNTLAARYISTSATSNVPGTTPVNCPNSEAMANTGTAQSQPRLDPSILFFQMYSMRLRYEKSQSPSGNAKSTNPPDLNETIALDFTIKSVSPSQSSHANILSDVVRKKT